MWATHQSLNKDGLLEDLHPSLKLELTMCVNEKLIKDVRCSPQDPNRQRCTAHACAHVHALHSSSGRLVTPSASRRRLHCAAACDR